MSLDRAGSVPVLSASVQLCFPSYATFAILMSPSQPAGKPPDPRAPVLYCPQCAREVTDPLICGDCAAVICRVCGSPLESPDELGIG
jgi:hypothetical protein